MRAVEPGANSRSTVIRRPLERLELRAADHRIAQNHRLHRPADKNPQPPAAGRLNSTGGKMETTDLFQEDASLPAQYWDTFARKRDYEPEKRLLLAVLDNAIR